VLGRRGHDLTAHWARAGSAATGMNPRNRANRRCRSRAYHCCRARSLVRRLLVASIVVISAASAAASSAGRAEPPSATLSVMNKGKGGPRRISCTALPCRGMSLRTSGTAWVADDRPLEVAGRVALVTEVGQGRGPRFERGPRGR